MIWAARRRSFSSRRPCIRSIEAFEKGLEKNDPGIAPSQIYAYAAIKEGVPFANGAPNLTVDLPAMIELSKQERRAHLRQGLQDRPDVYEDRARAGLQGAHDRRQGLVLDQHPRQSRRRSARRAAAHSRPRKSRSWARSNTSFSPNFIPISTATSTTRFASTTIRRAATKKKRGTTSTSSAGSAIRCS